jgi:DNA-binding beta-propeller fold protein YncE
VDIMLKRNSRKASVARFATPQTTDAIALTTVGGNPYLCACDGADVWVANHASNTVSRVRGSDGKLLETWTGASGAWGALVAMGRVLVTGANPSGQLYAIDPAQPAGAVTTVSTALGSTPEGLTFDGARVWTANLGGSVSIVTPSASIPWTVTTVAAGFSGPIGALFDGTNVWVTDFGGRLFKLDAAGAVLQTVTVGPEPHFPVFDGTNIWVPNHGGNSVTVVRASNGVVLQTLTGNGLGLPWAAAFDGERVLVANGGNTVSLWKAANLSVIGSIGTGAGTVPNGACSDGISFWVSFHTASKLARF